MSKARLIPRYYSKSEYSREFNISIPSIVNLIKEGKLKTEMIGTHEKVIQHIWVVDNIEGVDLELVDIASLKKIQDGL